MSTRIRKAIMMVALALLGLLIGMAAVKIGGVRKPLAHNAHRPLSPEFVLVYLLNTVLTPIFVIGIHEGDHYLAGRIVGFRAALLTFGPFRWERSNRSCRGWSLSKDIKTYGGLCMMLPMDRNNLTRRYKLMIAGGPIASFVLALVYALILLVLPASAHLLRLTIGMAALMSGCIALATLLPIASRTYESDGKKLLVFQRGGPEAERTVAMLELISYLYQGTRQRDLPAHLFASMGMKDGSLSAGTFHYFAYMRAVDSGEIQEANELLNRAVESMTGFATYADVMMRCEQAWFRSWYLEDPQEQDAAELLHSYPGLKYRLEVANLYRRGAINEALIKVEQGLKELGTNRESVFDIEQLKIMRTEIGKLKAA